VRLVCISIVLTLALLASAPAKAPARLPARLIDATTEVISADSITVGQRFTVRHVFAYADTLEMAVPREFDPGTCRVITLVWSDGAEKGTITRTAELSMMTLDLEEARMPSLAVEFYTLAGDTLLAFTDEVVIPVRRLAAEGGESRPLKDQWEAPRRYWPWIVAAAVLVVLAMLLWWWLRRRARRGGEAPVEPALPADYVALTELTRVERMNLVKAGEFKVYYTLVTDAVRRYLEARFGVDAMDRTTEELLDELNGRGRRLEKLDELLHEADLVKFAKYVPVAESGVAAMSSAREIVVRTTSRLERLEEDAEGAVVAAGEGGKG